MMGGRALKVGDSVTEVVAANLPRTQIVQYAGASGDYNPLHSDEVYATEVAGYRGVFAHGMLTMGLTGKALTNLAGPGRLTKFGVRFVSQVWPGDTLTATTTVTALRREGERLFADLEVKTSNQDGMAVMTGQATALVEGPPLEALPD